MQNEYLINLREYKFIKGLLDPNSSTFLNSRKTAIAAGYKPSYARHIRQYFTKLRILRLQQTIADKKLTAFIESHLEGRLKEPKQRIKKKLSKEEEAISKMGLKEVICALENLKN